MHWLAMLVLRLEVCCCTHRSCNPRGGILADDQGLGKTVSTIALIVTNQPGDDVADEAFSSQESEDPTSKCKHSDDQYQNAETAAAAVPLLGATGCALSESKGLASHCSGNSLLQSDLATAVRRAQAGSAEDRSEAESNALLQGLGKADAHPSAQSIFQPSQPPQQNGHSWQQDSHTQQQNGQAQPLNSHAQQQNGHGNANVVALPDSPDQAEQIGDPDNARGLAEGGTLIVCPTAVLNQWARELESKVAKGAGMSSATQVVTAFFPMLLLNRVLSQVVMEVHRSNCRLCC